MGQPANIILQVCKACGSRFTLHVAALASDSALGCGEVGGHLMYVPSYCRHASPLPVHRCPAGTVGPHISSAGPLSHLPVHRGQVVAVLPLHMQLLLGLGDAAESFWGSCACFADHASASQRAGEAPRFLVELCMLRR